MRKKITIPEILLMKQEGRKVTVLTAYDYPTARLVDAGGVDAILVGDSAGVVFSGHEITLTVTMDEMLYHVKAVVRAGKGAGGCDMPFMACQSGEIEALKKLWPDAAEGRRGEAVKIEGGSNMAPIIRAVTEMDYPGHGACVGCTPSSHPSHGGLQSAGTQGPGERILEDAHAVQEARCLWLWCGRDRPTAAPDYGMLEIPTIVSGSGPACDGQVLVIMISGAVRENIPPSLSNVTLILPR